MAMVILETKTVPLPSGVTFDEPLRRLRLIGAVAHGTRLAVIPNPTLRSLSGLWVATSTVSIDVTGSGDITIDSAVFDD